MEKPLLDYQGRPVKDKTRIYLVFPTRSHVLDHMNHLPQDVNKYYKRTDRYIRQAIVHICITANQEDLLVGTTSTVIYMGGALDPRPV